MEDDQVIIAPPKSWMLLCVERGLCDKEGDALSCLHTAVSKGFKYEFLTASEGDSFMADIPLGAEADEEEAEVTDTLLTDPGCDYGSLLPNAKQTVQTYADTFTPSQQAAFEWLTGKLQCGNKLSAAIIGPAGTGKSYVLNAVVAYCRRNGLVVAKLAPSGVAAHLIEGVTIHRFFNLDIELNCNTPTLLALYYKSILYINIIISCSMYISFILGLGRMLKFGFEYSSQICHEYSNIQYWMTSGSGLPCINIAVAESADRLACSFDVTLCVAFASEGSICALVEVLPHVRYIPLLSSTKRPLPCSPLAITHCAAAGTCKCWRTVYKFVRTPRVYYRLF